MLLRVDAFVVSAFISLSSSNVTADDDDAVADDIREDLFVPNPDDEEEDEGPP